MHDAFNQELNRELQYNVDTLQEFVRNNVPLLNEQQKQVYETLMQAVDNNTGGLFFLDAPGGTGKTFVISLILATIRSRCDIALALASSGIAATLLDGGRTAHSALKLPLNLNTIDTPTCNISRSSAMGKLLMQCKLIVWDECTMAHKKSLEALNFTLKDLRRNNNIFGGLMILLAGDFRQTLPVVPRGTPADELNACLKASPLWNNVKTLSLTTNMRVQLQNDQSAAQFSKQLLDLGNGKVPVDATSGLITLTNDFCRFVDTQLVLIENVFPNISENYKNYAWLSQRAILAAKNNDVHALNFTIQSKIAGDLVTYKSVDSITNPDDVVNYPTEFLNSLEIPGFPPHNLQLKVGTVIMILRNLNPPRLCNGTRLSVKRLMPNLIEATIINGKYAGEAKGCGGTIRLNQSNIVQGYTLRVPKISTKTYLDCGWLILLEQSYVAQMQVVIYTETPKCSLNTTDCRCSSLQFFDGPGRKALKIRQYCSGNVDYAPLLSTGSEAFIRYSYIDTDIDVNFEIKITPVISECVLTSLMVTNKTQVLTSPNYPLAYGNNLICRWFLQLEPPNTVISLRFTELDLENTTDCSSDYLEIYYTQWADTSYSNTIRMCHENHTFDLVDNISNGVKLKLHTDERKTSKGFRLEYKSTSCQNTYDKPNGRILFSDQDTAREEECVFTINVGQSNLTISLYISSFRLGDPASSNYLKVYDGPNVLSPLVITLDGASVIPAPIFSNGSTLTMAYKAYPRRGLLDMSYTSTDQGRGCGGRIYNVKGMVTSPMYPNLYKVSSTCRWDIAVPRPNSVKISFKGV
ncbi:hypothetical protein QTP88_003741 [Uroleucon formosanum]